MKTKNLCLKWLCTISLVALPSCKTITIKNTEACAVAGVMSAGMDCANTLKRDTREMTLDETIAFLEPQEEVVDAEGKVIKPARGAAICQSAADWNYQKTTLEIACKELGKMCSYELQQAIQSLSTNIGALQTKVQRKAKTK